MSTIDQYLRHVRFWVPRARRMDLVEELREALQQRLDEREEELGRPLNPAEATEALRAFGPPQLVVARLAGGRPVISAGLSFYFWRVLAIVLGGTVVAHAAASISRALASDAPGRELMAGMGQLLVPVLLGFTLVTLTFMALERIYGRRWEGER